MSGKSIGKTLNYGFAGNYAQQPEMVIDTHCVAEDSGHLKFGDPVFLADTGEASSFKSGFKAADFLGVASFEIKSAYTHKNMEGSFGPKEPAAVFKRGAISVLCRVGKPAPKTPVYIRIAANPSIPAGVVGGFEAAADGANTIVLEGAAWSTDKDSNDVAQLRLKNINLV